jgi:predicted aspartyl protease
MGTFHVDIELGRPGRRPHWTALNRVMVDTGGEVTWLPEDVLRQLGIGVFKKDELFVTADGRRISRDVGIALLRCGEFKTVDEVVFAKPGDLRLLGARTLEGFNALVDARRKRLVAAGPMPAAAAPAASARKVSRRLWTTWGRTVSSGKRRT